MTTTATPTLTELTTEELQLRAAALRAELEMLEGIFAEREVHMLVTSKPHKPVALCRRVFVETHLLLGTEMKRSDVLDRLVKLGVAPNTAKTQYGLLKVRLDKGELDLEEFEGEEPLVYPHLEGKEGEGDEPTPAPEGDDLDEHQRACSDREDAANEERAHGRD